MPIFDFKCHGCNYIEERFEQTPHDVACIKCGQQAVRIWTTNMASGDGHSPYYSSAMGVAPEQIAAEKARHPGWEFNRNGDLRVENPKDQKQKAKTLGMEVF